MDPQFPFAPIREDFCAFGIGDCGSKSSSKSTIDTETLNKSVSNFLSSQASSATASATNLNDMKIHIVKMKGGCDIDASQKINSSVKALASIDSVSTNFRTPSRIQQMLRLIRRLRQKRGSSPPDPHRLQRFQITRTKSITSSRRISQTRRKQMHLHRSIIRTIMN